MRKRFLLTLFVFVLCAMFTTTNSCCLRKTELHQLLLLRTGSHPALPAQRENTSLCSTQTAILINKPSRRVSKSLMRRHCGEHREVGCGVSIWCCRRSSHTAREAWVWTRVRVCVRTRLISITLASHSFICQPCWREKAQQFSEHS